MKDGYLFDVGDRAEHQADLALKRSGRKQSEQDEQLVRVTGKIAEHIRAFAASVGAAEWHMEALHNYVRRIESVAPASCDRILREMRRSGELNYEVQNRRQSLYRFIP